MTQAWRIERDEQRGRHAARFLAIQLLDGFSVDVLQHAMHCRLLLNSISVMALVAWHAVFP